jgi:DNA-binding NarL/FixJ family response regulator
MHTKVDYIVEAIRAGANGYVTKDAAAERLLDGLRQVGDGAFYLDPAISLDVSRELLRGPPKTEPAFASAYDSLTQREREVMRLVVEGLTTKEVAAGLPSAARTAEHHRCNLMKKLGLQNPWNSYVMPRGWAGSTNPLFSQFFPSRAPAQAARPFGRV